MSVITLPAEVEATIGAQSWGQLRYETAERSDETGASAVLVGAPPRWTSSLRSMQAMPLAEAGAWEALLMDLDGMVNHLAVYDKLRPAPQGTLRGTPVLGAAAAIGATSVQLASAVGTLKRGDWLQIGTGLGTSQLVKVRADATAAAGTVTVAIGPALRLGFALSTPVAWDKPVAYMRMSNSSLRWEARPNGPAIDGFAIDLVESWEG